MTKGEWKRKEADRNKVQVRIYAGHNVAYRQTLVVPEGWLEKFDEFVRTSGAVAPHTAALRENTKCEEDEKDE